MLRLSFALRAACAPFAVLASACGGEPHAEYTGAQLFSRMNCVQCHGNAGEGTKLAPQLTDKLHHWSRATLITYLKDPQAVIARDARLREQARHYSLPMTKFDMLRDDELERLADHVLGLGASPAAK